MTAVRLQVYLEQPMACYPSLSKNAALLVLVALVPGVCYFATTSAIPKLRFVGWMGLVAFGLGAVMTILRMFQTGATLIVDEVGIHFLRSYGTIPWAGIERIWIEAPHSIRVMYLTVRDRELYRTRASWWSRIFVHGQLVPSRGPIELNFAGLTPGIDAVWAHIRSLHPELTSS